MPGSEVTSSDVTLGVVKGVNEVSLATGYLCVFGCFNAAGVGSPAPRDVGRRHV